jgi:phosphatidylinositol alpha-1,6-mannosyltransferase
VTPETAPARILLVTRNLPPLVGGMERLNWHIGDELSQHADVWIIGPKGASIQSPQRVKITEVPLRPLWLFLLASAWQALRIAHKWRPNIVLAGSGLTAPAALAAARTTNARASVYLHGLDAAVRHPTYRAIWNPAIRKMDTVIANSHPTAELARNLGVKDSDIRIVHPGVQIPASPQSTDALQKFREHHGLGGGRLLLSIGRLTTRKGLREFVQHALPGIISSAPDVTLVVIGDAPTDSLHAGIQTRASIQAAADAAGVGQHIRFLGVITDPSELACAYESATLHVFPVRSIPADPEGFGMVAIEAAAHGLPTAAFATGGVVDAVNIGQSGSLAPPGDYSALRDEIVKVLTQKKDDWKKECQSFAKDFAWPIFGSKLLEAMGPFRRNVPQKNRGGHD